MEKGMLTGPQSMNGNGAEEYAVKLLGE